MTHYKWLPKVVIHFEFKPKKSCRTKTFVYFSGNEEIVSLLIAHRANTNHKNSDLKTALHLSVAQGDYSVKGSERSLI